jgi:copper chaperone CopZ
MKMAYVNLKILGMRCGGCAENLKNCLLKNSGVSIVEILLDESLAQIEFKQEIISVDDIIDEIKSNYFGVEIL